MKKIALSFLVFCLLLLGGSALAAPAAHSAYRLSFQGNMADLCVEPVGRWMDELLTLIDLRAECVAWESGSMTTLDFYVEDVSAASLSVLELSNDMYLSGSLFPEMPYLFDEELRDAATAFCEALFPPFSGPRDAEEVEISAEELADFIHALAELLRSASFPQETASLAFIDMLDELANNLAEDPGILALTMTRTPDEEGAPPLENASHVSSAAIERLLRALVIAIAQMG